MKLSTYTATIAWSSMVILMWLTLLGKVNCTKGELITGWVFFILLALISTAYHNRGEKQ